MSKTSVGWLYEELPELVAKGILTQEATDKLRQHYGMVKNVSKTSIALIILGTLGALLIGLGIILLLAHNWEQFSRFVRAIISLVPLVIGQGLALWVLLKRSQSNALKESVATFLSLMVGASIALISQTYNIPGDTGTFILTWMFLIVPITYLMQASLPAAIYIIGITAWTGSNWDNPVKAFLFWPLAAIIIPHFIWALRREVYTLRTTLLSLIMAICFSFGAGFSLGKTWQNSWIVIFPALYSIFYFIGWLEVRNISTNWQKPLRFIGALGLYVLAFLFTFSFVWRFMNNDNYFSGLRGKLTDIGALPDHIITLTIIALSMLLFYKNLKLKKFNIALFGAVPFLAIIMYLIREQSIIFPQLIFNAFLFILSISRISAGIRNNNLASINIGMLMLAILVVTRFFDSGIGFVAKGLVFITVGVGFLVVNIMFARRMGGTNEN